MKNKFDENLKKLQQEMIKDGIKAYYINPTDPHLSEYCHEHFLDLRNSLSAYTGSDGALLVTQTNSYLYTDGRYWIQAEDELKGTNTELVKMGAANVPSLFDFVTQNNLFPLALDYSLISSKELKHIEHLNTVDKSYEYLIESDHKITFNEIWEVPQLLLSTTLEDRVKEVLSKLHEKVADSLLLTSLDDIAYLLGFRGSDIPYNPVFYSYLYLDKDGRIFVFTNAESKPVKDNITYLKYEQSEIDNFLKNQKDARISIDPNKVNAHLDKLITNKVYMTSPTMLMKAIKGPIEISAIKQIHILDGIAMLKLHKLIKEDKTNMTEVELASTLEQFRRESNLCYDLSFNSIVGFGPNGAMMHYDPEKGSNSKIDHSQNTFLLIDSGGQYLGGTTDITRTFYIGNKPTREMIHDYTLTLKSVIDLSTSVFLKGCSGIAIDIKARENMWREGLDYKCGTGHGVGYMLNVHEGPNGFRYKIVPERNDSHELVKGMVTTIEPGVYKANKYGIRIENELLTIDAFKGEDPADQFLTFETVTYAPIDTEFLEYDILTDSEIAFLNLYHSLVVRNLAPYVKEKCPEYLEYLYKVCQPVERPEKKSK